MALSGTTPIRAGSPRLNEVARKAGERILSLIAENLLPRDILTRRAFSNAVSVAVAIGASVNVVRHLAATATEAGLDLDIIHMIEEAGVRIPQITSIKPNGPDRIETLDAAGGARAILHQLHSRLDLSSRTVDGGTLADVLRQEAPVDAKVVRPLDAPFTMAPGLVVLRGNLAPDGALVKVAAVPDAIQRFSGPARVFEDEDEALKALGEGNIQEGEVVVLRMMGPVGGPGTVFACSFMAALVGAGLASSVAVVTDGELSGLNRGITVGQVMPEAACGGPLAIVQEQETIHIDLVTRRLDLAVTVQEIRRRLAGWKAPERTIKPGWLSIYSQTVQPLAKGAVLGFRELGAPSD